MGYEIKPALNYFPNQNYNIKKFIVETILNNNPIALFTNYSCLYYSDKYLLKNQFNHTFLIAGYDTEKDIIILQEGEAVDPANTRFTKGEIYYKQRIKYSMLTDIINKTLKYFEISKQDFLMNYLFNINPLKSEMDKTEKAINTEKYLLNMYLQMYKNPLNMYKIHNDCMKCANDEEINFFFRFRRYIMSEHCNKSVTILEESKLERS